MNRLVEIDPVKRLETLLDNSKKNAHLSFDLSEVLEFLKEVKYCTIVKQCYEEAVVIRDIERLICHKLDEQIEVGDEEVKHFITLISNTISTTLDKIKNGLVK
jgi:hypothetical protein